MRGVSQLGQVETAIEEISGEISVFFYEDKDVKFGLPIMPNSLEKPLKKIEKDDHYACTFCGHTQIKTPGDTRKCSKCKKDEWIPASNKKRVT